MALAAASEDTLLLREILAELRTLNRHMEARAAPERRDDEQALAELLPQIWDAHNDSVWCVSDLAVAQIIERAQARSIGHMLKRNAGVAAGRFVLHPVGDDREGRLWVLRHLNR